MDLLGLASMETASDRAARRLHDEPVTADIIRSVSPPRIGIAINAMAVDRGC